MSVFSKWAAGFAVLAGAALLLADEGPEASELAIAFVWLVATSVFLGEFPTIAREADSLFGTSIASAP